MTKIIRPHGWGICIPPRLVWAHGNWIAEQELALLQPNCWMNWSADPHGMPDAFIPEIWASGQGRIRESLAELPGHTWLLWNEPDRPEQANMTPEQAYTATLDFLRVAWDVGEEFQWAAPGVFIDANEGLNWATEYVRLLRRHGIPRPNYWHIHSYRSTTLKRFQSGWADWLAWYAAWGLDAPVVMSETCVEYAPFDVQRAVMDEAREMLARGDVAGVMWFASHPAAGWPVAMTTAAMASRFFMLSSC